MNIWNLKEFSALSPALAAPAIDNLFQIWYDFIINMKYREILINQLKILPFFSKETFASLGKQFGVKATTLDAYISRSLKRQDIFSLKNGLYVTADYYSQNAGDISYTFYLANVLRTPSYVSSWSALQYYDLTTEAIGTVTSVTAKITRTYNNRAGSFAYQTINKDLFSGFKMVNDKFNFFIATPAKALFDLLYFRTNQFRGIDVKRVVDLVEDARIDIEEMEATERELFFTMVKNYLT